MQAELDSDVALSAATALLTHLRKHPEDAGRPARDIAVQFGLDESFVRQVLDNIGPTRRETRPTVARNSSMRVAGEGLRSVWIKLTSRPIVFVAISLVACFVLVWALARFGPRPAKGWREAHAGEMSAESLFTGFAILGLITTTFFLHMATYFRHRTARYAMYGGAILWGALMTPFTWTFIVSPPRTPTTGPIALYLAASVAMMMLSLVYTGCGALSAVLGGWVRIKIEQRREEEMSRQDLLERYFELQGRMQRSAYFRGGDQGVALFSAPLIAWYRDHQPLPNIAIGFVSALISILSTTQVPGAGSSTQFNAWFFVLMFVSIASFLFHILQGYVSRTPWRAAFGAICIGIGAFAARLLPIPESPIEEMARGSSLINSALDTLFMMGVSCAGYLGALVQARALRDASLQRNDQATLLAEMVRIQWRLSNESGFVCVLVVDAARSSEMKAAADPLLVEYTFREYQEWIQKICGERTGRVHSTAGDGAVVTFDACGLALSAAKRLQTDLFRFNKDENRLSLPFRLRIGLHTGEVLGDIGEVQFTEVIDIAAHIESVSPVGGIAVTDDVAARIAEEPLIDLNQLVDGHKVFMVANPTEYS